MENLKIVTFNLRCVYNAPIDGINSFVHRAGLILDKLRAEKPHIVCFQEVSDAIRAFLESSLPDYGLVGHGRLEHYNGEGLSIAYRKDCMELFGLEQFWLSPTPYVPASRYPEQSIYPRLCVCATVKHKEMTQPVRVYNVHLDHISDQARILGITQIAEKAARESLCNPLPCFIMGDFNATPDSRTITYCKTGSPYPMTELTEGIGETFHNFFREGSTDPNAGKQIDYVLCDSETAKKAVQTEKWTDCANGIYLSDHYPICCTLDFSV